MINKSKQGRDLSFELMYSEIQSADAFTGLAVAVDCTVAINKSALMKYLWTTLHLRKNMIWLRIEV